jgi:hypothetical protein
MLVGNNEDALDKLGRLNRGFRQTPTPQLEESCTDQSCICITDKIMICQCAIG